MRTWSSPDVPFDHPYYDQTEALCRPGHASGCSTNPMLCCPGHTMIRAEPGVFPARGIQRAAHGPPAPGSQIFADTPLICRPWQGHICAEGCASYVRMLNRASDSLPDLAQQIFEDVSLEAWYAQWAYVAYDAGLIPACPTSPELRFCPNDSLTRGLAACVMVQASLLTLP